MAPTLWLTTTLLLGQAQDVQLVQYVPHGQRHEGRLLPRGKLGGLFGKRVEAPAPTRQPSPWQPAPITPPPSPQPSLVVEPTVDPSVTIAPPLEPMADGGPPQATAPRKMPTRIALTPDGSITIETVEPELLESLTGAALDKARPDIQARFIPRLARAEDYRWVTGQLRIAKGVYELHYSVEPDHYGGIFVLEMAGDVSALHNGDLISTRGQVLEREGQAPLYRPTVIQIVERQ